MENRAARGRTSSETQAGSGGVPPVAPWVGRVVLGAVRVDRLDVEWPGVEVNGSPAPLQRRRGRLRALELSVDLSIHGPAFAPGLTPRAGFDDITLGVVDGELEIGARLARPDGACEIAGRAYLRPGDGDAVVVTLRDLRVHGHPPGLWSDVGSRLLAALAGLTAPGGARTWARPPRLLSPSEVEIDLVGLVLYQTLPPAGFRLPDRGGVRLVEVTSEGGRARLAFAPPDGGREIGLAPAALTHEPELRSPRIQDLETRLAQGDAGAALEGYARAAAAGAGRLVRARHLMLALALKDSDEARTLAERWLEEEPSAPTPLVALAVLEERRGDLAAAGDRYARAADAAAAGGEREGELRALLAASRLLLVAAPERARALLERAAALRPDHPGIAAALSAGWTAARDRDAGLALYREVAASTSGAGRIDKLLESGRQALARGDRRTARLLLTEAASSVGPDVGLVAELGAALDACDADDARLAMLDRAAHGATGAPKRSLLSDLGAARLARGDTVGAHAVLAEAASLEGASDPLLVARLALASIALGRRAEAVQALETFLGLGTDVAVLPLADAAKRLGDLLLLEARITPALAAYDRAIQLGAGGAVAGRIFHRMAVEQARAGDAEAALASVLQAADPGIEPDAALRADRLCSAALLCRDPLGRRDEVRPLLERALGECPTHRRTLDALEVWAEETKDVVSLLVALRRKVEIAAGPLERRSYLVRLGAAEERAGNVDAARASYREALHADPRCVPALLWLGRDALSRGDREEAMQRWNALLALEPDGNEPLSPEDAEARADAHEELAQLALNGNALSVAERHLRAAHALAPSRFGILDKLASILRAAPDRAAELAETLALLGTATPGAEAAAMVELERARALRATGASDLEVAASLARASELAPTLDEPLAALAEIDLRGGRLVEYAAMQERRAELARARGDEVAAVRLELDAARASNDEERVDESLAQLAVLLPPGPDRSAATLERAKRAIARADFESARRLLSQDDATEEHAALLAQVGTLGTGDPGRPADPAVVAVTASPVANALAEVAATAEGAATLEARAAELARAGESRRACQLLHAAARIYLEHVDSLEQAAAVLERALVMVPDDAEILERLEHTLRRTGEFPRLAGAIELHLTAVAGRARSLPLASLAEIWERHFADRDRAAALLAEAYALDPGRSDLLVRLGDYHFDVSEAAPALDYYTKALSLARLEVGERARVRQRVGDLLLEAGEIKKAEQWYRRALDDDPRLDPALGGLERIFRQRADRAQLAFVLVARAGVAPSMRTGALLREAADLYETIGRPADAHALRQRLAAVGVGSPLHPDEGDDPAAVAVAALESDIEAAEGARRAALLVELAEIVGGRLGEIERAERCLREAVALDPTSERALRAYAETLGRCGKSDEMCRVLGDALDRLPLSPEAEAALAVRLGHAHAEAQGDVEAAIRAFERAARLVELPVDACETLAGLYRAAGRRLALAELLVRLADGESGPRRAAWLEEAGEIFEQDANDPRRAAELFARVFREDSTRAEIGVRARRLYLAAHEEGAAEELALLELRSAPPEQRPSLRATRASILIRLGRHEEAEGELQAALVAEPELGAAHLELGRLALLRGQPDVALVHFDAGIADESLDPAARAEAAFHSGALHEEAGWTSQAVERYELSVNLDPTDRRPLERLERLHEQREDFAALTEIMGRLIVASPDRQERGRLWHRRALLYRDKLGREPETYRCLKEAVANDPGNLAAVADLRSLAETRGEWALAAELCYGEIASAPDDATRARAHVRLGGILADRLLDREQAARTLEEAALLDPSLTEARVQLADLYGRLGRDEEALRLWEALAESAASTPSRLDYLLKAGAHLEALGRIAEARARYQAVLSGDPRSASAKTASGRLDRLPDDAGRARARAILERRLDQAAGDEERVDVLRGLVKLAVDGGDEEEARRRAEALLEIVPGDPLAFDVRRRALEQAGDVAGLEGLLESRVEHVPAGRARAEVLFDLAVVVERGGHSARAATLLEQALATDPEHVPTLEALADQAYRRQDVVRARDLYGRLATLRGGNARDRVEYRLGEIEEVSGDLDAALARYRSAISANPAHVAAQQGVARIALSRGDAGSAVQALREVLAHLPLDAVSRITENREKLAELLLRVGDHQAACEYLELVLAQEPDRVTALRSLAEVAPRVGRWPRAAEVLGRLASLAVDADERAVLLVRQGDVYRDRLNDLERAAACFLKAIDITPESQAVLERLVDYAWRTGDVAMLGDVGGELRRVVPDDQLSADVLARIALGSLWVGDDLAATAADIGRAVAAGLTPSRASLLLSQAATRAVDTGRDVATLDVALGALAVASGSASWDDQLSGGLRGLLAVDPADVGPRHVLARISIRAGEIEAARAHLGVLAFLGDLAARDRLAELPPPPSARSAALSGPTAAFGQSGYGRALVALRALATPLGALGTTPPPETARRLGAPGRRAPDRLAEAPPLIDEVRALLGIPETVCFALPGSLDVEVAPGRPLLLLLGEGALALPEAELRFLVARAFALWRGGSNVVEGRDREVLLRLLEIVLRRCGAAPSSAGTVQEVAFDLPPGGFPSDDLAAIKSLAEEARKDLDVGALRRALREEADRIAWRCVRHVPAALSAVARLEGISVVNRAEREAALRGAPSLRALVEYIGRA